VLRFQERIPTKRGVSGQQRPRQGDPAEIKVALAKRAGQTQITRLPIGPSTVSTATHQQRDVQPRRGIHETITRSPMSDDNEPVWDLTSFTLDVQTTRAPPAYHRLSTFNNPSAEPVTALLPSTPIPRDRLSLHGRGGNRTPDLRDMSPASYLTAPLCYAPSPLPLYRGPTGQSVYAARVGGFFTGGRFKGARWTSAPAALG
jgi:hypothetical protein